MKKGIGSIRNLAVSVRPHNNNGECVFYCA